MSERNKEQVNDRSRVHFSGREHDSNSTADLAEQRQRDEMRNWRDASDITSFYFMRFPEDTQEKDLWFAFKK